MSVNNLPFFSVIIPTYNRGYLLLETIQSVLNQTFREFEIIIVDDGGDDNTKDIVFSLNDSKIKYYWKINEERGAARNFGISKSSGIFAIFLDSDDIMKSCYLDKFYNTIQSYPQINFIAGKFNFINSENVEKDNLNFLTTGWYDKTPFLKGNYLACNFGIRIQDYSYMKFEEDRNLTTIEDWLFLLGNLELTKIYIINEVLLSMREHNARSMNNNKKVINARKNGVHWAINNLSLTESEKNKLIGWSHYFCAIHEYLDFNRIESFKEIFKSIKYSGFNLKFAILILKSIIGRKIILYFK